MGTPKAMLRQFEEYLTRKDWHEVQEGVEVQLVPGPEGDETFVLARSVDRREKEKAMHQRFVDRLEAALQKMQASAESGRLKDEAVANRRLGRLMGQYWRAGGAFDVKIERLSPPQGKARLRVTWTRNKRWSDWAALSEGCYLLRTNLNETDPATLWKRYIQLTDAEWAFRITKDELEIRPIWHQKDRPRAGAHPGLLPGVCVVEDAGPMDAAVGPGRCAAHGAGGVGQDQERRRGVAHRHQRWPLQRHSPAAVRYRSRTRPKKCCFTASALPCRDASDESTSSYKCSGNFYPKSNVSPYSMDNLDPQ